MGPTVLPYFFWVCRLIPDFKTMDMNMFFLYCGQPFHTSRYRFSKTRNLAFTPNIGIASEVSTLVLHSFCQLEGRLLYQQGESNHVGVQMMFKFSAKITPPALLPSMISVILWQVFHFYNSGHKYLVFHSPSDTQPKPHYFTECTLSLQRKGVS